MQIEPRYRVAFMEFFLCHFDINDDSYRLHLHGDFELIFYWLIFNLYTLEKGGIQLDSNYIIQKSIAKIAKISKCAKHRSTVRTVSVKLFK